MPLPEAMVKAARAGTDVRHELDIAFAWLRSDAPEAVALRKRMADAFHAGWLGFSVDQVDVSINARHQAGMLAALAELVGEDA